MTTAPIEPRDHLIGPCALITPGDEVVVDVGTVVRRLVLFERYTLRTARMREIRVLTRAFGEAGLRALLADGCLRILCEGLTMGSMGGVPLGSYRFTAFVPHDQRDYVSSCLQEIRAIDGLTERQIRVLKRTIADALAPAGNGGAEADRGLDADLDNNASVLRDGIALAARDEFGLDLNISQLKLEIERVDELTVRARSNLEQLLGLDDKTAHRVIERGLLAVGGLNARLELMHRLNGISGCAPGELNMFDGKLRSLMAASDPDAQEQRLLRVLSLAELPEPDLDRSPAVDVEKLLDARSLPEARALRSWLRTADQLDDTEIRESFDRVKEALARAVHGTAGKVVRLAITTAAGLIPGGIVVGAGASALDAFLVNEIVAQPGPYSFLSRTWPSLFSGA